MVLGRTAFLQALHEELRDQDLPAAAGPTGAYSQAGRPDATAGDSHGQGPGRPNGGVAGARADLRGGLPGQFLRVPSGQERPSGDRRDPPAPVRRAEGGVRRGPEVVLRHDPPRCVDASALERRIADRAVLTLIRMWLECPISETDDHGKTTLTRPDAGDAARGGDLPVAGEPVPALVREGVLPRATAPGPGRRPSWSGTPTTS